MTVRWTKSQLASTKAGQYLFGETIESTKESRADKMRASRKVTNEFQAWVIKYLNDSMQFKAWRNNNIPSTRIEVIKEEGKEDVTKVHYKKNQKTVSTLDVIGFRISDGKHLEIEIKTGKDKLDKDQLSHLTDLQKSGCISFATGDKHTFMQQITPYMEERKLAF